ELADGGRVIVDSGLVDAEGVLDLPFTRTAEEVGAKIVTNIVMLGYLGALVGFIPHDVLEETVLRNIPKGTEELNRRALAAGRALHQA
ncbi:MAG: 2-oxoacid:ferredoxin oxidoreductase subunit gamma, partial [bacterium]|nr:2-oxoacid:ferredoxin oxidoreductase subunit gamma [bacterium]